MVLLANRVSASRWPAIRASTSETPNDFAARRTASNSSRHFSKDKIGAPLSAISRSDLDVLETGGARAVTCSDHLLGLPLAAIRHAPQSPVIPVCDGHTGIPELRRDSAIGRILEHTHSLAIANLPSDLASELEVVALVVDRPASVGFHRDRMAHPAKYFIQRLLARKQAHVGHADERLPGPTGGPHCSVRARLSNRGGGLPRRHVADELAAADDVRRLRRNAFVVERECAQAGPVLEPGVAYCVDDLGAIAQIVQLVEGQEAHAGVVGLRTQHAIQLNRVPDRFMDLEPDLAAVQNQIEASLR